MKRSSKNQRIRSSTTSLLSFLGAALCLFTVGRVAAQPFSTLYTFTNGTDGSDPATAMLLMGNTFYGTAYAGGDTGNGTVFGVNTGGTNFTTLYGFTNGTDGASPTAGLVLSGSTLYGTAESGGANSSGTVFALNTNGGALTVLHAFTALSSFPFQGGTNSDGADPRAGLLLSGSTLFGTANYGGSKGFGTVFALNTANTNFTTLYSFTNGSDGAYPVAGLILSGTTLYGTAFYGGTSESGTVFSVGTNGANFTTLYTFTNGSDGSSPQAGLVLSGATLYGAAAYGGSAGYGTLFAVPTNGSAFQLLHTFSNGSDGAYPQADLLLSGSALLGTSAGDGSSTFGTVFYVNTNGLDFTVLYTFSSPSYSAAFGDDTNSDGTTPQSGLMLAGLKLYGTAGFGGMDGGGTVFSLTLPIPPRLGIARYGTNVVLTWTNAAPGFNLESTTNLSPAAWSTNLPAPVVINWQYTVTNSISGTHQFFRLSQ